MAPYGTREVSFLSMLARGVGRAWRGRGAAGARRAVVRCAMARLVPRRVPGVVARRKSTKVARVSRARPLATGRRVEEEGEEEEEDDDLSRLRASLESMGLEGLSHECKDRMLSLTGNRVDLVNRIVQFERGDFEDVEAEEGTVAPFLDVAYSRLGGPSRSGAVIHWYYDRLGRGLVRRQRRAMTARVPELLQVLSVPETAGRFTRADFAGPFRAALSRLVAPAHVMLGATPRSGVIPVKPLKNEGVFPGYVGRLKYALAGMREPRMVLMAYVFADGAEEDSELVDVVLDWRSPGPKLDLKVTAPSRAPRGPRNPVPRALNARADSLEAKIAAVAARAGEADAWDDVEPLAQEASQLVNFVHVNESFASKGFRSNPADLLAGVAVVERLKGLVRAAGDTVPRLGSAEARHFMRDLVRHLSVACSFLQDALSEAHTRRDEQIARLRRLRDRKRSELLADGREDRRQRALEQKAERAVRRRGAEGTVNCKDV